jgi:hypothetical protein
MKNITIQTDKSIEQNMAFAAAMEKHYFEVRTSKDRKHQIIDYGKTLGYTAKASGSIFSKKVIIKFSKK